MSTDSIPRPPSADFRAAWLLRQNGCAGALASATATRLQPVTIGVLPGEGIGPEVIAAALCVLRALESASSLRCQVETGGRIGMTALRADGRALSDKVVRFCESIFKSRGAVLAGPGGGRFVYEMRRQFDLYCKLNPLVPRDEIRNAGRMKPEHTCHVDVLIVRENSAGIYQGASDETTDIEGRRVASHSFAYTEEQVARIVKVAAALAQERRGDLAVVTKPHGIPAASRLWSDVARETASEYSVNLRELEIDYAVFHLLQCPQMFDVIVAPNLFGDVLSDVGGVLLGSRGLCYAGSFSDDGAAVYQTNHGAAHDLAGTDRANPVAQIFSLAMLLRESFGCTREAALIEQAVGDVWREGFRTHDLVETGCHLVGTHEMSTRIADRVVSLAKRQG